MTVLTRLLGAAIGGGGTFVALHLQAWVNLPFAVIAGGTGIMALMGLRFGPRIWEVVAQL